LGLNYMLILQLIAFFFLMVPYFLVAFGKWEGKSLKYIGCNLLGGLTMTVIFAIRGDLIFFLLNFIWSLGGAIQLLRLKNEKK